MTALRHLTFALFALAGLTGSASAEVRTVASIPPVHSIVAGVMGELGKPHLLVSGGQSPHAYSLRPSDAAALDEADLVVWVGPGLETFLDSTIDTLAGKAMIVEWAEVDGVTLLEAREGGVWAHHDHSHGAHDHDHDHEHADEDDHEHEHAGEHEHEHEEGADMHLWLDPANAIALSGAVADALAELDPANAATYRANHDAQVARLNELDAEIRSSLSPVKDVPFIVFHDAYQYFGERYGLAAAGSVTVNPEVPPGAARLRELRDALRAREAACIFAEPQFRPDVINTITENTDTQVAVLDPLGADIEPGANLYPALLRKMTLSLVDCLSAH